jgi:hypothetical protein
VRCSAFLTLRIHADRSIVPPGGTHAVMLYPFWGKNPEDPADPDTGRFDRYESVGSRFFEPAPLDSADVVVFPCNWTPSLAAEAEGVVKAARDAGKPAAVFAASDDHVATPPAALVFQTSLRRSVSGPNEFALPAWSADFVTAYLGGEVPIRRKRGRPVVGFCGLASRHRGVRRRLRAHEAHSAVRGRALRLLEEHRGVDANFVVRDRFLGGALRRGRVDAARMQRVRAEYVQNIVESDYILCARGAGNFSYRLYETLSCGRIPVFVDTDAVLPLDFVADWRAHCVWVDESELESIGDRVADFHRHLDDDEFVGRQHACRRFWQEYVAPEGFFEHFHEHVARIGRDAS